MTVRRRPLPEGVRVWSPDARVLRGVRILRGFLALPPTGGTIPPTVAGSTGAMRGVLVPCLSVESAWRQSWSMTSSGVSERITGGGGDGDDEGGWAGRMVHSARGTCSHCVVVVVVAIVVVVAVAAAGRAETTLVRRGSCSWACALGGGGAVAVDGPTPIIRTSVGRRLRGKREKGGDARLYVPRLINAQLPTAQPTGFSRTLTRSHNLFVGAFF